IGMERHELVDHGPGQNVDVSLLNHQWKQDVAVADSSLHEGRTGLMNPAKQNGKRLAYVARLAQLTTRVPVPEDGEGVAHGVRASSLRKFQVTQPRRSAWRWVEWRQDIPPHRTRVPAESSAAPYRPRAALPRPGPSLE